MVWSDFSPEDTFAGKRRLNVRSQPGAVKISARQKREDKSGYERILNSGSNHSRASGAEKRKEYGVKGMIEVYLFDPRPCQSMINM